MQHDTITLYGDCCPWEHRREILWARPITYGIAQMAATPFATNWTAAGDIVTFNECNRVTSVVIRNSRTHHGRFDAMGLDESEISRLAGRLGSFFSARLIGWTFVTRFPGVFSLSVDVRTPLERLLDIVDVSPVPIKILQPRELRLMLGTTVKE